MNFDKFLFSHIASNRKITGTLALGGEWWAIVTAVFLLLLGALNIFVGCRHKASGADKDQDRNRLGSVDSTEPWRSPSKKSAKSTPVVELARNKPEDVKIQVDEDKGNQGRPFPNAYEDY